MTIAGVSRAGDVWSHPSGVDHLLHRLHERLDIRDEISGRRFIEDGEGLLVGSLAQVEGKLERLTN